ncbi:MAG: methionyl-tRNA formyltransferase [Gammaproteobacteria bacterium]|nr:MAG: methionyl-tRNA formyltransferase [Gammaproteobacteria bacterium]
MSGSGPRIVFAGSPAFAVPSLRALAAGSVPPCAVLTQPDRPAGRGRQPRPSAVKQAAESLGLPLLQPERLDAAAEAALRALAPDLMVVVAYGLLLPPSILSLPRRGCVNLHASLLPRWRGASPVQAAILAGDAETGVSLMQMDAGLDSGPVYAAKRVAIGPEETAGELAERLAALAAELLLEQLDGLLSGRLEARPQPVEGVSHAPKIRKSDARIDWSQPAELIARQVRAYNPWPVAETLLDGQRLRIWQARPAGGADAGAVPGQVLAVDAGELRVQTGAGALQLLRLQLPGRKPVTAAEFVRARRLTGTVLGR